ncbi:hypothetical protein KMW28_08315 [Flammeovirga yaeyamensis]|uniref:Uncharacterized protein n=1 Tax=Flammeovirga yaeyamensis TaxID=367791 RepID=A0AAX1N8M7_9BACT|nr:MULTISPECIES: hypothetical protein [Flammeovirga]ANQ48952.1 hypothetical protein MY04_1576 [Flammeovirga sp. MY04]MBB3699036.1 hypothetical protein [Flammeovirga yaeyamensis]NMF36470.1 hypothetical protein [Flammeovirga yaeyamensis]QWG03572.1 hypothetical protein KMW28_08315 [Flammeovirga yaeyamensis]
MNNHEGIIIFFIILFISPFVIFMGIGLILRMKGKDWQAKIFFTIAVVYAIVGTGICGTMLS